MVRPIFVKTLKRNCAITVICGTIKEKEYVNRYKKKVYNVFLSFLVCHAEMNAILNKNSADVKNCTIYVALFPCNECAKFIIQSGIKEIIYLSDKHAHKTSTIASKRMLDAAGIKYWLSISKIIIRILTSFKLNNPSVMFFPGNLNQNIAG